LSPNQYIENTTLSKEIKFDKLTGSPVVSSDVIKWKPNMDLTKGKDNCFWSWFHPDDEDLELAQIIKEEIWPDPYKVLVGDPNEDDDDDEGDDGEGDGEDDNQGEENQQDVD